MRYAEEQQDLALLSISTFQRALKVKMIFGTLFQFAVQFCVSCFAGSKSVDSSERIARFVKYSCDDYRSDYDAFHQRINARHVAVCQKSSCSRYP